MEKKSANEKLITGSYCGRLNCRVIKDENFKETSEGGFHEKKGFFV